MFYFLQWHDIYERDLTPAGNFACRKSIIMKLPLKAGVVAIALAAGLSVMSCKSKSSNAANNDTTTTPVNPQPDNATVKPDTMQTQAPQISRDDSLTIMAKDAVKDYPGVTATVKYGEVTLTGDITRDRLPKLLQAINATHPRKVDNKLTIK